MEDDYYTEIIYNNVCVSLECEEQDNVKSLYHFKIIRLYFNNLMIQRFSTINTNFEKDVKENIKNLAKDLHITDNKTEFNDIGFCLNSVHDKLGKKNIQKEPNLHNPKDISNILLHIKDYYVLNIIVVDVFANFDFHRIIPIII